MPYLNVVSYAISKSKKTATTCSFLTKASRMKVLLTHTVNNLLQKLYYVEHIQNSAGNQIFNSIHIMCENFRRIPWILCKIQLL